LPHQQWWQQFLRDRGGTGFWHETYFRGGQIESVYIDMPRTGLAKFAPVTPCPRLAVFSAPPPGHAGNEADRRRVSRKKSCISGEDTEGGSALGQRHAHRHYRHGPPGLIDRVVADRK
jgi:hypothetical protein